MFDNMQSQLSEDDVARIPSPYVKYIVGLVALILIMFIALGTLFWREHNRDLNNFAKITGYFMFSEQILEKMKVEIGFLEDALAEGRMPESSVSTAQFDQSSASKVESTIYGINQHMAQLQQAQEQYQDTAFQLAFERLERSHSVLLETMLQINTAGEMGELRLFRLLELFGLRVAQLDRLHAIASNKALSQTAKDRVLTRNSLALTAGAVTLAIFAMVWLTVRRVARLSKAQKLAEFKLSLALVDAQKANAAKTDFLAHMSHDLRTPLNSILGFSQMMRSHTFGPLGDARYEEYANLIHHSGDRLVNMVNDVLDFARIESGEYVVHETELDISEQAKQSFQRCTAMTFDDLDGRYSLVIDEHAPALKCDARALSQILDNLLSNAFKYAGDEALFSIGWHVGPDGRGVLQVIDTGQGMTKMQMQNVLKPFVQGSPLLVPDPYVARTSEGVGLGLHIVCKLAAILGAEFTLESEEGNGTVASLIFPAAKLV